MSENENVIVPVILEQNRRESLFSKHPNEIKELTDEEACSNLSIQKDASETASKDKVGQRDSSVENEKDISNEKGLKNFSSEKSLRKNESYDLVEKKRTFSLRKAKSQLFVENRKEKSHKFKTTLQSILESYIELFTMAFFTCFVLFGPDLKSISLDPKYDDCFNIIYFIVLILFFLEFFVSWYVRPGYIYTFFYWLDLLAITSMFFEIDWFLQPIVDSLIL
jgi:hypothetical protein